jgi:hypothetical protein
MPRIAKYQALWFYRQQRQATLDQAAPEVESLTRDAAIIYNTYAQTYWKDPADKLTLAGYGLVDNVENLLIRLWNPQRKRWDNCIYITFPDGFLCTVPQTGNGSQRQREYYSGGGTERNIPALDPIVARMAEIKAACQAADAEAYAFLMERPTLAAVYARYPNLKESA